MLIVNADDFGASHNVNAAIIEAFKRGYITSTTTLANSSAFDDARHLAYQYGVAHLVGIHLNLTEGNPLTQPIKRCRRFCDKNGSFCFKRFSHPFLSPKELHAIYIEFCAQIDKGKTAFPRMIHADSHHHVHTEFLIGLVAIIAARSRGLMSLRLSDNVRPTAILRKIYKQTYNAMLGLLGMRCCDYFCDLAEVHLVTPMCASEDQLVELMVHPIYADDGQLIDASFESPLYDFSAVAKMTSFDAFFTMTRLRSHTERARSKKWKAGRKNKYIADEPPL